MVYLIKSAGYDKNGNFIDLLKIGLEKFEDLLDNKSVKAVAILDKNLALAIKKEFD